VVVVPGTLDSSVNRDPHQQAGVLAPTIEEAGRGVPPGEMQTTYVPYPADFGYTANGTTYANSSARGVEATNAQIRQISAECGPDTDISIVGYSQGAEVAHEVAAEIGDNRGPVPPSRVRGVYLISDPNRSAGTGLVPGAPGLRAPLNGARTQSGATEVAVGGGIDSEADTGFGALTGRVVSLCETGDFACSIPKDAQVVRTGANIAEQIHIDTSDPSGIASDLGNAVAKTALVTGAYVLATPNWLKGSESLGEAVEMNSSAAATTPTLDATWIPAVMSFVVDLPVSWDARVQQEREAILRDNLGLQVIAAEPSYWFPGPSHVSYFEQAADSSGRTGSQYVSTWIRESAVGGSPETSSTTVESAEPTVVDDTSAQVDAVLDTVEKVVTSRDPLGDALAAIGTAVQTG
jgi:pimeloyl-ACP methyl ester carboxylesterase